MYQVILNEEEIRVWQTLKRIGISKPVGKLSIRLVDRGLLNQEALKINARGNLRGLTLTKYKIVKGGSNPGTTFDHRIYILYGLPYIECESVLAQSSGVERRKKSSNLDRDKPIKS